MIVDFKYCRTEKKKAPKFYHTYSDVPVNEDPRGVREGLEDQVHMGDETGLELDKHLLVVMRSGHAQDRHLQKPDSLVLGTAAEEWVRVDMIFFIFYLFLF